MEQTNQINQNQGQQQFRCTGDCLTCRAINDRKVQWQYCAAQKALENQEMLVAMMQTVKAMAGEIRELNEKIKAIQDSEAMVFDPNEPHESQEQSPEPAAPEAVQHGIPIAQKGAGA